MRNLNKLTKIANVVSVIAVFMLICAPLFSAAQFTLPDNSSTGLPGDSKASGFVFRILQILLTIAGIVAVVFLVIGGFRYITSGGNEEAAETGKKTIINAIIGIVVIILSFVIVRVIANALTQSGTTGV